MGRVRVGATQQKILLMLFTGIAIGLTASPFKHGKIIRAAIKEWKDIDEKALDRSIRKLYESKLVAEKVNQDGSITLLLNDAGKERALRFSLDTMSVVRPKKWDGKWRMVLFDIPERQKKLRDVFRRHLQRIGFYEFQKSVFVFPYPCDDELDFLIEFHHAKRYVRTITVESIDNEPHLLSHFKP